MSPQEPGNAMCVVCVAWVGAGWEGGGDNVCGGR